MTQGTNTAGLTAPSANPIDNPHDNGIFQIARHTNATMIASTKGGIITIS